MSSVHSVGSTLRRPEGPDKVTGRATYVADLRVPDCWWGGVVRSHVARGRLRGFTHDSRWFHEPLFGR